MENVDLSNSFQSIDNDKELLRDWLSENRITDSITSFQAGSGIEKLNLRFDIDKLKEALEQAKQYTIDLGAGFGAISLTCRPGHENESDSDLIGLYHLRPDETYQEVARDEAVDEAEFSQLIPKFKGTYFEKVHHELSQRFAIGRMRILFKEPLTCNSWHRDPEPRIHIPIITNPGSLFVINHHVTHLPADGSIYFTDTRAYHMAMNGGEQTRIHIVAALPM